MVQAIKQQVETLKKLTSMMGSGGADMATRMLPQVLEILNESNAAGLQDERAQVLVAKRQAKLHAYRVLQHMCAFTKVAWPLAQILEDARATTFQDFELI